MTFKILVSPDMAEALAHNETFPASRKAGFVFCSQMHSGRSPGRTHTQLCHVMAANLLLYPEQYSSAFQFPEHYLEAVTQNSCKPQRPSEVNQFTSQGREGQTTVEFAAQDHRVDESEPWQARGGSYFQSRQSTALRNIEINTERGQASGEVIPLGPWNILPDKRVSIWLGGDLGTGQRFMRRDLESCI